MSARLTGAVYYLDLPSHLKLILSALADHADDDGDSCYPSMETLAVKSSCDRRQAQRNVRTLEDRGYVATCVGEGGPNKVRADRRPNRYKLDAERIAREAAQRRQALRNGASPEPPRSDNGASPVTERGGVHDRNGASPTPPEPNKGNVLRKATKDARANARSKESPNGEPDPKVKTLVAYYVDECGKLGVKPISQWRARVGRQIRQLLGEGKDEKFIKAGLRIVADERKPGSLVYVVADLEADVHKRKARA